MKKNDKPKKCILFVCLGNICRSAAAEAVAKKFLESKSTRYDYVIDSAGTAGYHEGENADPRMIFHGNKRGYNIDSISRKVRYSDFEKFDWILPMDHSNRDCLLSLACTKEECEKVKMLTDFCSSDRTFDHVPDPYYGGAEGFDHVIDILEDAISNLLREVENE
ncbi:low molecular weight protein-tyrosine-phosphatase [Porphyromonas sp. COT-108 OH1349]|uniref:low molecular weight protein-tyrosine-phosphatase n=1 Tax=Porphyromonas sp. COT-108 OH1349 TaxID=1537504 RepID=UPI00052C6FEA|nr:low molecular weight protein-tyrosine-phosphatase [Porphyromonas sp. COT-108 OH1349]KGN70571.1 hypothetical protein JT26_03700 [Porphyromonas sp. COT-108 OH1349]